MNSQTDGPCLGGGCHHSRAPSYLKGDLHCRRARGRVHGRGPLQKIFFLKNSFLFFLYTEFFF